LATGEGSIHEIVDEFSRMKEFDNELLEAERTASGVTN
jgi:hypothetical protein